MIRKKPLYVQQPSSYVFLGVTMQIHLSGVQTGDRFVQMAGTPVSQDASTPRFPDPEQMQRLRALAEEFGVRILAAPELPARN